MCLHGNNNHCFGKAKLGKNQNGKIKKLEKLKLKMHVFVKIFLNVKWVYITHMRYLYTFVGIGRYVGLFGLFIFMV